MCGGFTCSKNALTALNILYILVAFILIGVAVYGRESPLGANLPTIGGILACGIFLILISIIGLIGAIKHHQVLLFFYMLILFLLFLVQFSVACACLAVNMKQQAALAREGWGGVPYKVKDDIQISFQCCSFDGTHNETTAANQTLDPMAHPHCPVCYNETSVPKNECPHCMDRLQQTIDYAFKLCGGIGLFFSFTEVVAAVIAYRYRNQFDPRDKAASAIINRRDYSY